MAEAKKKTATAGTEKTAPKAAADKAAPAKVAKPAVEKSEKPAKAEKMPVGKTVKPPKAGDKPNALQQKLQPSEALAAVVGAGTMARGEVVSKVWAYIKGHKLQNPDDGREIVADDTLRKVLGKDRVTMFEMNKLLAAHLK